MQAGILSAATAEALELPRLLALVAELAGTDLGRERVLTLRPVGSEENLAEIRRRQEEMSRLLLDGGLIPEEVAPYRPLFDRLREGEPLEGREIVRLASMLRTTEAARKRILAAESTAAWGARLAELESAKPLMAAVRGALDRRGQVRDDASPKLASIRRSVQRTRDGLYRELRGSIEKFRDRLAEETIPLRDGRLVLVLQAGARGRLPGLVHGSSASGRSQYFEPMAAVEGNNQLQQALAEEQAERARILLELLTAIHAARPLLEAHADLLAELDRFQAAARYQTASGGALAETVGTGQLRLVAARHPLLDPRLASLREKALGTTGNTERIVPLDVELDEKTRALVVTGPNAGGKTVALKTVGLLAASSQCGLPVPAAAGTRLPQFEAIVAVVGDEQDLLADRSTFSGRLLRLREAWEAAGPDSLILLDELGSGTDPEEGAALALALLEELLDRRSLALLTTHLVVVAAAALERPGAGCAAMEFEEASGEPTYHLLPGPPGGSEAVALARRLGLPAAWLDRAEELLGADHRDLRQMLKEVEALRRTLLDRQLEADRQRLRLARERTGLEEASAALEAERKKLGAKTRRDLDQFRRRVRSRLAEAETVMRGELEEGRRRGVVERAVQDLFETVPEIAETVEIEPEPSADLEEGSLVRHRTLGWEGTLMRLAKGRAEVAVRGKRFRCAPSDLVASVESSPAAARPRPTEDVEGPGEINLIGRRVEPALEELERFLDRALLGARNRVRVVHGHGTGRLRGAIRKCLERHPAVTRYRPGHADEGGDGATMVILEEE